MTHAGHRAYKKVDQRNRPCDLQDDQPLGPLVRLPKQEGAAIRGTARLCRLPEQELYEIARHLDVDVKELLVLSK